MKVKDLIKELSELNPESTLMFSNHIECFRSDSGCSFIADYQLNDFTKKEFKQEVEDMEFNSDNQIEDEDEYKKDIIGEVDKNGVVVFMVTGVENWNQ
jgi:hypothetical protein